MKLFKKTPPIIEKPVNEKPYSFYIDSPKEEKLSSNKLVIRGWVMPSNKSIKIKDIQAKINSKKSKVKFGIRRDDVYKVFLEQDKYAQIYSGFYLEIEPENGLLELLVDIGNGYEKFYEINIKISKRSQAGYWDEHLITLENKKQYYFEDNSNNKYLESKDDPKLVAFYLPQFHPIPENDKAWGKGFTEWHNVTTAQPRFVGHLQPFLPRDLGFYDLRLKETIGDQIKLAKQHGIYGFCFYYYWFSGKKVLETPLNTFLTQKDWNYNFMICWANENWTKRWDGKEKDVIISQKYTENDPINFIMDVEPILLDKRYIRTNNKPVLVVYRGSELNNPKNFLNVWRSYFKEKHNLELEILTTLNFDDSDPTKIGFDGAIEFTPQADNNRDDFNNHIYKINSSKENMLDADSNISTIDYRAFALLDRNKEYYKFRTYKCVAPSWDNDARKKGKGSTVVHSSSPDLYARWLDKVLETEKDKKNSQLVFINAWNEWAEGAVLEPTMHNGSAVLNRTTEILSKYSKNKQNKINFPIYGINRRPNTDVAVIVHLFYEKEWKYIARKLKVLKDIKYDLFVTLSVEKSEMAETIQKNHPYANITMVPNRGRDVLPFLFIANRIKDKGYKYILKLHTKRSVHLKNGKDWFIELTDSLLHSNQSIKKIIKSLNNGAAFVGPKGHYIHLDDYMGRNELNIKKLLEIICGNNKTKEIVLNMPNLGFIAGTMFWCRLDSIKPILDLHLTVEDFENESGQTDGTIAHALERIFAAVAVTENKSIFTVSNVNGEVEKSLPTAQHGFAKKTNQTILNEK